MYSNEIMAISVEKRRRSPSVFHFTCFLIALSTSPFLLLSNQTSTHHPFTVSIPSALCSVVFFIRTESVVHFNQLKETRKTASETVKSLLRLIFPHSRPARRWAHKVKHPRPCKHAHAWSPSCLCVSMENQLESDRIVLHLVKCLSLMPFKLKAYLLPWRCQAPGNRGWARSHWEIEMRWNGRRPVL